MAAPRPKARLTAEHAYCLLLGLVLLAGAFHLHELGLTFLLPLEQSAGQRSARAVHLAMANRSLSHGALAAACSMATSCAACISSLAPRCTWEAGRCLPGMPAVVTCPSSAHQPSTADELAGRLARAAAAAGVPVPQMQTVQGGAGGDTPTARPPAIEVGASNSQCARRRPYHVILTAASGLYQEWQTRIAYYHYRKLKERAPCSDLGGFTRLLSTPGGAPDGLMTEIPTILTKQLSHGRCDTCDHGFVVMNRPWSLKQLATSHEWSSRLTEEYLFIMETDHLLLRPPPNTATPTSPVGFGFYYMTYKYDVAKLRPVVERWHDPDEVDPVGPSPLIIHKSQLAELLDPFWNLCLELKRDQQANAAFGWVLEMWAWALAAARAGVRHQVHRTFQAEPGGIGIDDLSSYNVYHYTFDLSVAQWAWSKRRFMAEYPPRLVDPPARGAKASIRTFVAMMNEAIDSFGGGGRSALKLK